VHTRRIATFLLGAWLGGSVFMAFVATYNLRSAGDLLYSPIDSVQQSVRTLGNEPARLLLRHHAAEINRALFRYWENGQLLLGLTLMAFLLLATERRILPPVLCGIMLAVVLFQHFGVIPELIYRGREGDFPPGNTAMGVQTRVWALHQVYVGVECVKLLTGAVLAGFLFAFRTRRRRRTEDQLINDPDHSHVNG
jgi:hypothetical protein